MLQKYQISRDEFLQLSISRFCLFITRSEDAFLILNLFYLYHVKSTTFLYLLFIILLLFCFYAECREIAKTICFIFFSRCFWWSNIYFTIKTHAKLHNSYDTSLKTAQKFLKPWCNCYAEFNVAKKVNPRIIFFPVTATSDQMGQSIQEWTK